MGVWHSSPGLLPARYPLTFQLGDVMVLLLGAKAACWASAPCCLSKQWWWGSPRVVRVEFPLAFHLGDALILPWADDAACSHF